MNIDILGHAFCDSVLGAEYSGNDSNGLRCAYDHASVSSVCNLPRGQSDPETIRPFKHAVDDGKPGTHRSGYGGKLYAQSKASTTMVDSIGVTN